MVSSSSDMVAVDVVVSNKTNTVQQQQQQHVILFYKYHPLSPDAEVTETYRASLERLCQSLSLTGRILVGHSKSEGINGTLAGNYNDVLSFTLALLENNDSCCIESSECVSIASREVIRRFWAESRAFFESIGEPELRMESEDDFKWSTSSSSSSSQSNNEPLFPDLNVKLVKELIGSGGVMSSIPLEETATGYLTPREWHEELLSSNLSEAAEASTSKDAVVIDCRNAKEYEIGHFSGAIDPVTTTFAQFPKWVKDNRHLLSDKNIYMYCTGGIRCEKASAFVRREISSAKSVKHLKGGIHKYLEEYGQDGMWKGRNFVFDSRGAASAEETRKGGKSSCCAVAANPNDVIGRCVTCSAPYDSFDTKCVCTICREPTLTCLGCQDRLSEYHCRQHAHLRTCYFSNLERFSAEELRQQLIGLESALAEIAVGRRFRQRRQTLQKQCERVKQRLEDIQDGSDDIVISSACASKCRSCGEVACTGRCWGFYGLKRKEILENKSLHAESSSAHSRLTPVPPAALSRQKQQVQSPKEMKRDRFVKEICCLQHSLPPSSHRDSETGIRVPPCTTRILRCVSKAKFCGRPAVSVMQEEFVELSRPHVIQKVLEGGLLRINDEPIPVSDASHVLVKSSDVISRVIHWHEAPVIVPPRISVEKVPLPFALLAEYGINDDALVYVCNKPSTVPVHPAGPYLANSLTMMVEAQEELDCQTLTPLHRTDRATSGLTLCCTDPNISRVFHKSLSEGQVQKLYLAKVRGRFISSVCDIEALPKRDVGCCSWCEESHILEVDAPVETVDPANGIRAVTTNGKPSKSLFRIVKYDADNDTSLLACCPRSGRNHQLRVHLQWLGFPILNDIQYGGELEPQQSKLADAAVRLMHRTIGESCNEVRLPELSETDVNAARQACSCCNGEGGGIIGSFTQAQLLNGGHAICLHALRYRVAFLPKKQKSQTSVQLPLAFLDFQVDPPTWADQEVEVSWLEQIHKDS